MSIGRLLLVNRIVLISCKLDPNVKNALLIDQSGIGDISNHTFVPLKLVAAWNSNATPKTLASQIFFDDNGSYGTQSEAYEFYPVNGPFEIQPFYDPDEFGGVVFTSYLVRTVIIFESLGTTFVPLNQAGSLTIRFFPERFPLDPGRMNLNPPSGGYTIISFYAGYNQPKDEAKRTCLTAFDSFHQK
jgi:hypothetical protein